MRVLFGDRVHFSLIITKIYPPNILLHLDDTLFDGGFGGFVEWLWGHFGCDGISELLINRIKWDSFYFSLLINHSTDKLFVALGLVYLSSVTLFNRIPIIYK